MDKKGDQLGIGGHVHALVDQDQKLVNQVEDGDCELVTIIECVCADGTAVLPSSRVHAETSNGVVIIPVMLDN